MGELTALLADADLETRVRLDRAFELLYPELQVIARSRLRRHGGANVTGTGALVHECWLRLQRAGTLSFEHQGHFLALAASVMRSAIVDLVRRAQAGRRGGDAEHVPLSTTVADQVGDPAAADAGDDPDDVLALDAALQDLVRYDERAARVVEMRFFAGYTDAQAAMALGVSERTVRRDWERARAFLALALQH